jgi:Aromatic-ring hydroxylase, C-terminal
MTCSASGQQGPPGRDERGRERPEQLLERDSAVGLTGHEGAVDGGQREPREPVSGRARRIVAERGRDLRPQQLERVLAYPADDGLDLPAAGGRRLRGEDDQQAQEVRVALKRAGDGRHHPCEAASQLAAEAGVPLDAVRIGHLDGDYHDPRSAWQRHRQITSDGAILVRPDRFIAWRHPAAARDPQAVLAAALSQILARPVGRVATPA